jgi:diketogulonate reductase-like aldo/keto reductase
MRTHRFGATGREVPVIGQGTWQLELDAPAHAIAALRRGLELGLTHIDTAELYGGGVVEDLVGAAIAGRRDGVFLVSKVLPSNASYAGTIRACERSLARLMTDRLDCYLLHWPGAHPLAETLRAFEWLQRSGRILSYGVSNFDRAGLEEALALAGEGRIACNQVRYDLAERSVERELIGWSGARDVATVGYSPFGHGRFPSPRSARGRVLAEISAAHGASPRQVALAFLVRARHTFTIPKATTLAHVEDNARAGDLVLAPDEVAALDTAFTGEAPEELPAL